MNDRKKYIINGIIILGFTILFFFPEPEVNFGWYFITFILLIGSIIGVYKLRK